MWMTPYGYIEKHPEDYQKLIDVGQKSVEAVQDHSGKSFQLGTIADIIYSVGGSSVDWIYANGHVKYAYALELRPTHADGNGFLLPIHLIKPTVQETWSGIMAMAKEIYRGE